jgi:hypothetical protein
VLKKAKDDYFDRPTAPLYTLLLLKPTLSPGSLVPEYHRFRVNTGHEVATVALHQVGTTISS